MKRFLDVMVILMGLLGVFCSTSALGSEYQVSRGDTVWRLLSVECGATPTLEKARIFAKATGIENPNRILRGSHINVSHGCEALPEFLPSIEKVVSIANAQNETLHALQGKVASLEAVAADFRVHVERTRFDVTEKEAAVQLLEERHQSDVKKNQQFMASLWIFSSLLVSIIGMVIWRALSSAGRNPVNAKVKATGGTESVANRGMAESHFEAFVKKLPRWPMSGGAIGNVGSELNFFGSLPTAWVVITVFFKMKKAGVDIPAFSLWRVVPIEVPGHGYDTYERDESGQVVYAETLDAFRASLGRSIRAFLESEDGAGASSQLICAMQS